MEEGQKAETFFEQVNKTVKQLFNTIEQAILTIPKVIIAVLGEFEILVLILQIFLVGLAWMWLGDFLMRHIRILRFILHVLNDVAIACSKIFGVFGDATEEAINVVAKGANFLGSGVNDVISLFGGGHPVPKIPVIPLTKFPVLNFEGFIASLDGVDNAATLCAPFHSLSYELLFPIRYALNNQVCPVVRYMTNTIVYEPFAWLLSMFYFNADPQDLNNGNCIDVEAQYICYFLSFGDVLIYIITPLMVISFLWPWISKLVISTFKLIEDMIVLVFEFIIDICSTLFHRDEEEKKEN